MPVSAELELTAYLFNLISIYFLRNNFIFCPKTFTYDTLPFPDNDGKTVNISPISRYLPAHPYYLYITSKALSSSGQSLSKPTCMSFTIKANAIKAD